MGLQKIVHKLVSQQMIEQRLIGQTTIWQMLVGQTTRWQKLVGRQGSWPEEHFEVMKGKDNEPRVEAPGFGNAET